MIYPPAEDSALLARNVKKYVKGKTFLDMGAGSGIQSETARLAGAASILAVDVDHEAVHAVKSKGFNSKHSNLFASIRGTFEVIAFNPPYLPLDVREDQESRRITTGGKRGDELTIRFIKALPRYLSQGGVALLVLSSLTSHTRILSALRTSHLTKRVIDTTSFFMETLEVWELTRKAQ